MNTSRYPSLHGSNTIDAAVWQIAEGSETVANVLACRSASADRVAMDEDTTPRSAARYEGRAEAYERSMNITTRTADAIVARLVKMADADPCNDVGYQRAAELVAQMLGTSAAPIGAQR